mgnify:CR=1 FL=1
MTLMAGFAEVDITPPIGTHKIGWIKDIVSDSVLDPLFARVAVFQSGEQRIAFIALDTLSVRWTLTNRFRHLIAERYGFDGHIMVAATHNHAGPAIANVGDAPRDEAYVQTLTEKVLAAFGRALENLQQATYGFGWTFEFGVSFNRRVIMRDGTTRTHGSFADPNALCFEGPIDPEVAVLAVRSPDGRPLGALVNFACHPTHHGGGGAFSAGYPGQLVRILRKNGWPTALFLNGACGNIHTSDPTRGGSTLSMEEVGRKLAEDALAVIGTLSYRSSAHLAGKARTIQLPYRKVTDDDIRGTVRGAQRFVDPSAYDRAMNGLLQRIAQSRTQPAEVQALMIDQAAFVSIPAEYFVQHGLRIKEQTWPTHSLIVGHANGMVGYVPHREAFSRGGYETTFGFNTRLAPEAGDLLADCAIELVRELSDRSSLPPS